MKRLLRHFAGDQSGATAIEYSCMSALVSLALVTVVQLIGQQLQLTMSEVQAAFGVVVIDPDAKP